MSASGNALLIPSAAAWFASAEVRHPLKESMAMITFMFVVVQSLWMFVQQAKVVFFLQNGASSPVFSQESQVSELEMLNTEAQRMSFFL